MRTYCYRTEDGEIVEIQDEPGFAAKTIELKDGRVAYRDYQAELVGSAAFIKGSSSPVKSWPMVCYASGVHSSQAGELRDYLAKRGCNTEVTKEGDPIYTSASHRKKALKLRGMFDRNSFN